MDAAQVRLALIQTVYPHQSIRGAEPEEVIRRVKVLENYVIGEPSKPASTTPSQETGKPKAEKPLKA